MFILLVYSSFIQMCKRYLLNMSHFKIFSFLLHTSEIHYIILNILNKYTLQNTILHEHIT